MQARIHKDFAHPLDARALASLRGGICIGLPLVLGLVMGQPTVGTFVGVGAVWAVSQDGVDALRGRLPRVTAVGVASALGLTIGGLILHRAGPGFPVWALLTVIALITGALELSRPAVSAGSLHLLLGAVVGSGMALPGAWWSPGLALLVGSLFVVGLAFAMAPAPERRTVPARLRDRDASRGRPSCGTARPTIRARARFSVLLAGSVLAAAVLGSVLADPRSYWLPLTVAFIFRPSLGPVANRAAARTVGTAAGATIALVMSLTIHDLIGAAGFAAVLGAALPWAARRSHALTVSVFTPIVFVFLDMAGQDHGLFTIRIADTLLGAAIVLGVELLRAPRIRGVAAGQLLAAGRLSASAGLRLPLGWLTRTS